MNENMKKYEENWETGAVFYGFSPSQTLFRKVIRF